MVRQGRVYEMYHVRDIPPGGIEQIPLLTFQILPSAPSRVEGKA